MRLFSFLTCLSLLFTSCVKEEKEPTEKTPDPTGFVRVNSTIQAFSEVQPWDRKDPASRRGLGALLENKQILTTSEMAANCVYLELESADGSAKIPAKVVAIDRAANLALLEPEDVEEESFLDDLKAFTLAGPLKVGSKVEAWQLENNGQPTTTTTKIHSVDVVSSYGLGKRFFSYLLKGSLQSASNSYTIPVLADGKIAGILTSYDSEEQISEVLSSSIIEKFLEDAADGDYEGFPTLGIAGRVMSSESFREWVGLEEEEGGLYITRIGKDSASERAGVEIGDVLVELDGYPLDRKGYYDDPIHGKLIWTNLIRGPKGVGETLTLKVKRKGEILTKEATLLPSTERLIPYEFSPEGPQYFIKGGVIFQQLTRKYLQAFGKEWSSRAPLNLLDLYYQSEDYEEKMEEAIIITGIIPSQNTVGYESVRNSLVEKVNGVEIRQMADLETGFASPIEGIHHIELDEAPYKIYLDAQACIQVDQALLGQGLPALSRIHTEEVEPAEAGEEKTEVTEETEALEPDEATEPVE